MSLMLARGAKQSLLPFGRKEQVLNRQLDERARGRRAMPGPGRPRKANPVARPVRPELKRASVLHVTVKLLDDLPSLRTPALFALVRKALLKGQAAVGFRVVIFSVQVNHLHLVVEADTKGALSSGMRRLNISLAKSVNHYLVKNGFCAVGRVLKERYHAELLTTPTQVRNCIAYVLFNAHKHGVIRDPKQLDPYTSAENYDGFAFKPHKAPRSQRNDAVFELPLPVKAAESWLLRIGWRKLGLILPRMTSAL